MEIKPLTQTQKELYNALNNERIKFLLVLGPSGSGKSILTFNYCIEALRSKKYERLIIFKPIYDIITKQLYSILQLGNLYFKNVEDYLYDLAVASKEDWEEIKKLINQKIIISDLSSLLGRTFDNSLILIEDAHTLKSQILVEALMRIGNNSRIIIIGDPLLQEDNSLRNLKNLLQNEKDSQVIELGLEDIVRATSKIGIKIWLENKLRERKLSQEENSVIEAIKSEVDVDIVTAIDLRKEKEEVNISSQNVPDIVIITKEGQAGKIVGKEGKTIEKLQKELNLSLRVLEDFLNEKELIRVLHPAGKIYKSVDAKIKGSTFYIYSNKETRPIVLGFKGTNIRFFEKALNKIIPLEVKVI
ncbi:MAG: PhoH family protein [Candidatus Aenigmatarchaeota archaeon]